MWNSGTAVATATIILGIAILIRGISIAGTKRGGTYKGATEQGTSAFIAFIVGGLALIVIGGGVAVGTGLLEPFGFELGG